MPTGAASPASPLYNELALRALEIAGGIPAGVPTGRPASDCSGIVIGFVDYGFDLLHPCLLSGCGTRSRFLHLWDQNSAADLNATDLNRMIAAAHAAGSRAALDAIYDPHANYYGRHGVTGGAHGTLIASMAAGTAYAGFRSAAPFAGLIGVQLAKPDTAWREELADGTPAWTSWQPTAEAPIWTGWRTYGASQAIVHGIRYIVDRARKLGARHCIVNLSIGAWAGAHDGQSAVELAMADAVKQSSPSMTVDVVIAAGNAGADQGHFAAVVRHESPNTFDWLMNTDDPTQNKLEVWYGGDSNGVDSIGVGPLEVGPLEVGMTLPDGTHTVIQLGRTHEITIGGHRVGIAEHSTAHPTGAQTLSSAGPGRNCVRILLHPPYFPRSTDTVSRWSVTLRQPRSGAHKSTVHAWIERDDGLVERSWLEPSTRASSLGGLATAVGAIVVGAVNHHHDDGRLTQLPFSGTGPHPWDAARHIRMALAPGYRIWGAESKTTGFAETSGTSAAAALMSGKLAADYAMAAASQQAAAFQLAMGQQGAARKTSRRRIATAPAQTASH